MCGRSSLDLYRTGARFRWNAGKIIRTQSYGWYLLILCMILAHIITATVRDMEPARRLSALLTVFHAAVLSLLNKKG
jgi:hypothetical protein